MSLSADLLKQVHLSGESGCGKFQPHPMKANFCTGCSKLFNKHSPNSIASDDMLIAAIEYSQKGQQEASCIISGDSSIGGLFLGGFGAVVNQSFLKTNKITHVLNTAGGLEIFGGKYPDAVVQAKSELGITFLQLKWEDLTHFCIPEEDLVQAVRFIHHGRLEGSVLVHCAQGKSRSATAVVAYLMITQNKPCTEALATVQGMRKMAEPNPTFMQMLRQFEHSPLIQSLRTELQSH